MKTQKRSSFLLATMVFILLINMLWQICMSYDQPVIDSRIPKDLIKVVENHFQSIRAGDENAFIATLTVEDPSDVYMEPWTMETFESLKNTEISIKEIGIHVSEDTDIVSLYSSSGILKVTISSEYIDDTANTIWIEVSKHTGTWGIACYISENQLSNSASGVTVSELDLLAQKISQAEYEYADLRLLLSSSIDDIGNAYGVDMKNEPSGGLILTGRTLAAPVIFMGKGIFVIEGNWNEGILQPFSLLLYGQEGEGTAIEGFTFGMESDIGQYTLTDTFLNVGRTRLKNLRKY